jgi:hypothetical protein
MVVLRTSSAEGIMSVCVCVCGGGGGFWLDRCLEFEAIVGRFRGLKAFATSGNVTSTP